MPVFARKDAPIANLLYKLFLSVTRNILPRGRSLLGHFSPQPLPHF
ncbi:MULTISPECIES: hypothetical protein [Desertifilum]|nr:MULTISPECIES: hypothetical protein [Desertifilum]MBD2323423.1 hypothetical protein [Desertifilum sp. FACHB-866]MBD2333268.1 hypothetical protein [Desertifilum sp. FACHB-868]